MQQHFITCIDKYILWETAAETYFLQRKPFTFKRVKKGSELDWSDNGLCCNSYCAVWSIVWSLQSHKIRHLHSCSQELLQWCPSLLPEPLCEVRSYVTSFWKNFSFVGLNKTRPYHVHLELIHTSSLSLAGLSAYNR